MQIPDHTHPSACPLNTAIKACLTLSVIVLSACGGGGETTSTTTSATATSYSATATSTSTSAVGCPVSDSGSQLLTYYQMGMGDISTSLDYDYSVTCSGNFRTFVGNGVPNHSATGGSFASAIAAQTINVSVTSNPDLGVSGTSYLSVTGTTLGNPGIAINTVKFDPGTAGTCLSTATSGETAGGCDPTGRNGGTWVMEALDDPNTTGTFQFRFGLDDSNAHTQPNGQYHYHGMPTGLVAKLNTASSTSMILVGWAADGYPMYARYGYTTATDDTSAIKVVTGSYQVKSTTELASSRPSISTFSLGHFTSDWKYVAGSGDLDECNGRYGVTPEFPKGTYHYYITDTYPFIQRCVKGNTVTRAG